MTISIECFLYNRSEKIGTTYLDLDIGRSLPQMITVNENRYFLESFAGGKARYQMGLLQSSEPSCVFCGQKESLASDICPKGSAHDFDDIPF